MGLLLRGNTRRSLGRGERKEIFEVEKMRQGLAWTCNWRVPSTRSYLWRFPDSLISGVWETTVNPILAVGPSGHVGLASSQSPGFTAEEDHKAGNVVSSFQTSSEFHLGQTTLHKPQNCPSSLGWGKRCCWEGKTIRNTISVIKAGHKYLSSLSGGEGQDDSSQFLVLTKEEAVHETGHLPGHFYLSDPTVGTREAWMIGLAAQPFCASAVSAICNDCNPQMWACTCVHVRAHTHTHTHKPAWWTHSHTARQRWPLAQTLSSNCRGGWTSPLRADVEQHEAPPPEFLLCIPGGQWQSPGHPLLPCVSPGPDPMWCPLSWCHLSLGLSFQASIWLFLGWSWLRGLLDAARPVDLAAPAPPAPGFWVKLSLALGHPHTPGGGRWGVSEIEDEHGDCKCPVLCGTQAPSAGICNHLAPTPTSRKQSSRCWGHCASMADGHMCQLPRDLS